MPDTTFILVTGTSPHSNEGFVQNMTGMTNHGEIEIEFIDRINKDDKDIFHHDFKIVVNSKEKGNDSCIHIDHGNYKRKSVINHVMSKLSGFDIILSKKMMKSDSEPFIYLDSKLKIKQTMCQQVYSKFTHYLLLLRIMYEVMIMIFFYKID